jgi:hypothetical protein
MSETLTKELLTVESIESALAEEGAAITAEQLTVRAAASGKSRYTLFLHQPFKAYYLPSAKGTDAGHYENWKEMGDIRQLVGGKSFNAVPGAPFIVNTMGTNPRLRVSVDDQEGRGTVTTGFFNFSGHEGVAGLILTDVRKANSPRRLHYTVHAPDNGKVSVRVAEGDGEPKSFEPNTNLIVKDAKVIVLIDLLNNAAGIELFWQSL